MSPDVGDFEIWFPVFLVMSPYIIKDHQDLGCTAGRERRSGTSQLRLTLFLPLSGQWREMGDCCYMPLDGWNTAKDLSFI